MEYGGVAKRFAAADDLRGRGSLGGLMLTNGLDVVMLDGALGKAVVLCRANMDPGM